MYLTKSAFIQPYSRRVFLFAVAAVNLLVYVEASEEIEISSATLDYYLFQAFEAPTASDRIALNHIGIAVQEAEDGFLVTAALEGYPAHRAGIERGDKIVSINGEPYHPVYSFNDSAVDPISLNSKLSTYHLEFERLGVLESTDIVPVFENLFDSYRSATLDSVQAFPLGNKTIAYIRFWGLSRSTTDLSSLEVAMSRLRDSDGMIIDLRNSYGYLSSKHLEMFIRNNGGRFLVSDTSNRHAAITASFNASDLRAFGKPIVVLVNAQTRGGPELFAYSLSKLSRVTTLGENSAGNIGSYTVDEDNEDTLNYLPAEQALIDGLQFEAVGVSPKQIIVFPYSQDGRSDPQFDAAVDILLETI